MFLRLIFYLFIILKAKNVYVTYVFVFALEPGLTASS